VSRPEKLLRALIEHEVDFHVIGALAAWLQGNPSVTLGIDVMPRRDLDNAERLAAALNDVGARLPGDDEPTELEGADFLGWRRQRFDTEAGPMDIVPHAEAIGGFEDVATVELALGDLRIRVLTIDEVIASKESLGRAKDTAALPALYATRAAIREKRQAGK
jgi:hypothetical protein